MSTKDSVYIALFAALMAILGVFPPVTLSFIAVPITAQSLGPMLAGVLLGAKRATLAMLLFCVLVAIGLPLLSGGRGGIVVFIGPTAGFIYGWVAAACFIGMCYQKLKNRLNLLTEILIMCFGGIGIVYAFGAAWLVMTSEIDIKAALLLCVAFIPGDLIKLSLVLFISRGIKRAYPPINQI